MPLKIIIIICRYCGIKYRDELIPEIQLKEEEIIVEIVFATPELQVIVSIKIDTLIKPTEAIALSNIQVSFPEYNITELKYGVFGKLIDNKYKLKDRDRIEIYRPLKQTPNERRLSKINK